MEEKDKGLKHRELTQKIIGIFYEVYNELDHGFLESVYEAAFEMALVSKGINVVTQIRCQVGLEERKSETLLQICLLRRPFCSS